MQASIDHAELRSILGNSQAVVIMCPDVDNVPAHDTLNVVMSELNPKKHKVMIAESFGGNDEPVDKLTQEIVGLGIEPEAALRVKAEPTEGVRAILPASQCCLCSFMYRDGVWGKRSAGLWGRPVEVTGLSQGVLQPDTLQECNFEWAEGIWVGIITCVSCVCVLRWRRHVSSIVQPNTHPFVGSAFRCTSSSRRRERTSLSSSQRRTL